MATIIHKMCFPVEETIGAKQSSQSEWTLDDTYHNLLPPEVNSSSPAFPVLSTLHCSVLCQTTGWCNSFFYNDVSRMCALQFLVYVSPASAESASGWNYFRFTSASCPWTTGVSHMDYVIDRVSMTCYRVVTSQKTSWFSAHDDCMHDNDTLTVLDLAEKAKFIHEFMNKNEVYPRVSNTYYFIGGSRPVVAWNTELNATSPDYIWLNGQAVSYTGAGSFWYSGRPNNYNNVQNVMSLRAFVAFLWDDVSVDKRSYYICERPLSFK